MNDTFVSAVLLLFLVADPFGNIPIFISALREVPPQRRLFIVLRECLIAFVVLTIFVFAGRPFLQTLGLSEIALQIGGGVVLMLVALRMVFPSPDGVYGASPGGEPFIVPLAVPALAGPSALATVMLLVSKNPARWPEWIAAIAVVMVKRADTGLCWPPSGAVGRARHAGLRTADGPGAGCDRGRVAATRCARLRDDALMRVT